MENIYQSIIVTLITFALSLFYYEMLFKKAIIMEEFHRSAIGMKKFTHHFGIWLASLATLFITALTFNTIANIMNLYYTAPEEMTYAISIMLWLLLSSCLIFGALRTHQSKTTTFIHIGFWLCVSLIYAFIFPLINNNIQLSF
jgi:hypothetical protein